MNRLTPEFYIGFMMLLATFIIGVVIGSISVIADAVHTLSDFISSVW